VDEIDAGSGGKDLGEWNGEIGLVEGTGKSWEGGNGGRSSQGTEKVAAVKEIGTH